MLTYNIRLYHIIKRKYNISIKPNVVAHSGLSIYGRCVSTRGVSYSSKIEIDINISPEMRLSTMFHEYFHAKYHHSRGIYNDGSKNTNQMELEANLFSGVCMMSMSGQRPDKTEQVDSLIQRNTNKYMTAAYKCRFDVIAHAVNRVLSEMKISVTTTTTADGVEAFYLLCIS